MWAGRSRADAAGISSLRRGRLSCRSVRLLCRQARCELPDFEAVARTDFDVRGHMIAGAPKSAFQGVTISITVTSDAPEDELGEMERLAFKGCPGISTLREPVPVGNAADCDALERRPGGVGRPASAMTRLRSTRKAPRERSAQGSARKRKPSKLEAAGAQSRPVKASRQALSGRTFGDLASDCSRPPL